MGIPQVPEQVRRAPMLALRAVFAGIGRIVVSGDRPEAQRSLGRPLDATGNVRLLSADEDPGRAAAPSAAPGPGAAEEAASVPPLPLDNYDSLSLASIRARLRGLDVGQLKILLDYEAQNAERPEVIGMFERRIEKLESGG